MAASSNELIAHERAVMPLMNDQHWGLMHDFDAKMRTSFLDNVSTENIGTIESWMGSDEEIEKVLFWYKDGKFDDEAWQSLEPVDTATKKLWQSARKHYQNLIPKAVKSQRLADLALFSHFNPGLLYTGVAPAVRCDQDGAPDANGGFFKGVELRLVGSVPGQTDSITIWPTADGFETGFGARADDGFSGINMCAADFYSLKVLRMLIDRGLDRDSVESRVENTGAKTVELDKRAISKAIRAKQTPEYGGQMVLFASKRAETVDEAIEVADGLIIRLYESFGLEREGLNLGRELGNFVILRDANFDDLLAGRQLEGKKGLVFLTATLVCRRCRRELASFYEWAKEYPHLVFVLVNLNTPVEPFYNRVFFDMGGEDFRMNAQGATPFVIPYAPGSDGMEYCGEYIGTGKAEGLTSDEDVVAMFSRLLPA